MISKSVKICSGLLVVVMFAGLASAQTRTATGGVTYVKLSSEFVAAAQALNLKPGTVAPSVIFQGGTAAFPVVAGAIDLKSAKGELIHSGGLTLTSQSGTRVRLQSFTIDTTGTPVLTGLVVVNNQLLGRLPLFTLQLPSGLSLPLQPNNGLLNLKGVGVKLTSHAATALNTVFKVDAFKGGLSIGQATVWAYVR